MPCCSISFDLASSSYLYLTLWPDSLSRQHCNVATRECVLPITGELVELRVHVVSRSDGWRPMGTGLGIMTTGRKCVAFLFFCHGTSSSAIVYAASYGPPIFVSWLVVQLYQNMLFITVELPKGTHHTGLDTLVYR